MAPTYYLKMKCRSLQDLPSPAALIIGDHPITFARGRRGFARIASRPWVLTGQLDLARRSHLA